jgi:hypothetical protein
MSNIEFSMSNVKVKKKQQRTNKNPEYETRNSKQIQITEALKSQTKMPPKAVKYLTVSEGGFIVNLVKNSFLRPERYVLRYYSS